MGLVSALAPSPALGFEADPGGAPDSASWIPAPAEERDDVDRLEDRDGLSGAGLRAEVRAGRAEVRRAWARAAPPFAGSSAAVEMAWLARPDSGWWGTARFEGRSLQLAAGAVVARGAPVLFGNALGLSRSPRAPRPPRASAPAWEAPRGGSSLAIRGAAARVARGAVAAWIAAGADVEDAPIVAGGLALERRNWAAGAAGGVRRSRAEDGRASALRAVSLAGRAGGDGWLSGEALLSPERGPALLLEAAGGSGPFRAAARWRRRSGETRPAAGELILDAALGRARTRITWSAWSARASSDDGRLEIEGVLTRRGPGSARLRAGGRPGGERYWIADVQVARERGRSLSLLASGRERRRPGAAAPNAGSAARSAAWGGRLDWSARGRAGATLLLQAARADADGAAPAWAPAIAPSGEESLVARGRAGVMVTGRAWVRAGPLRVEALVTDAGADGTDRPVHGSLRVEWSREGR